MLMVPIKFSLRVYHLFDGCEDKNCHFKKVIATKGMIEGETISCLA